MGQFLYVAQAAATRWPSGRKSTATLKSRIRSNRLRGNLSSSTFRARSTLFFANRPAESATGTLAHARPRTRPRAVRCRPSRPTDAECGRGILEQGRVDSNQRSPSDIGGRNDHSCPGNLLVDAEYPRIEAVLRQRPPQWPDYTWAPVNGKWSDLFVLGR